MRTTTLDSQHARARSAALQCLARREHSVYELATKLTRKYKSAVVGPIVEELTENGELSDKRFAETLVRSRFDRGFGPIYISKELRSKGIEAQLAKECIGTFDGEWLARAREVLEKKRGQHNDTFDEEVDGRKNDDEAKAKAVNEKLARFLFGRGYPSEIVFRLF